MKNPNFDEMDLDQLIASQRTDDNDVQFPESRTMPIADLGIFDRYLDPDAEAGAVVVARTPVERRPNINGYPGVYDDMDAWTWKVRTGTTATGTGEPYRHPRAKGCRTHGFAAWRTHNMQTGEPLGRAYCAECKEARR